MDAMSEEVQVSVNNKARVFWPLGFLLLLTDCATKSLAQEHLLVHVPRRVLGETVQLTLAYNEGAAMGLSLGGASRMGFALISLGVLAYLLHLYRGLSRGDASMAAALALLCGGAAGNLMDRLRSARGVIDFIDVGVGSWRFYTFNVADMGVSIGAAALAVLLWRRDSERHRQRLTADG
ncbi:MAG: signal peptidase II [Gemmatimonadaceae bacterium]